MQANAAPSSDRIVALLRAHGRRFAATILGTAVLAAAIAFALPNWYRAESTMLPPQDAGGTSFGLLTGIIQSAALSQLGLATSSTPSDVFGEILKSRTLNEAAIERFGLTAVYKKKGSDRTLKEFRRHLAVKVNAAGLLTVAFEDRDAKRAAEVTNFLVSELDRFNVETYKTRGKRLRQFLEGRLADVEHQLTLAEDSLQHYERVNKVVSAADAEAAHGMADILAQKFSLETQRSFVSSYTEPGSVERAGIDKQLAALNQEIGKLPELKREGARLALDVEVQRKLVVLLTAQVEDARMQETRDTPTVTVLDAATPPQIKARPVRWLIVLVSTLVSVFGCAAWAAVSLSREP
ncbi:MAG: hypothetical protein RL760_1577 [Candidatus Eisenbacteria bacterium]